MDINLEIFIKIHPQFELSLLTDTMRHKQTQLHTSPALLKVNGKTASI